MAGQESLGTAELVLTVNDKALRDGIRDAKKFISKELGQAFTVSGRGRQSSGEKRFSDRAQATQVITRRLGDQLQRLSGRGIDVTKQFAALDRAGVALNKGLVEVARAQNKGVQDFIKNEQRKQAAAKRTQAVTGSTLRSPIQGSLRLPGSPIFSARGARLGGQRESIDALFQAQKRRYSLDQQIRSLEAANVNTDKQRAALGEITTAQAQRKFGLAKQLGDQLEFNLRKERDRVREQTRSARATRAEIAEGRRIGRLNVSPVKGSKDLPGSPAFYEEQRRQLDKAIKEGGPRSSIRGSKTLVGSPAFLEEQARRRRGRLQGLQGRISSGLIGGAFPLLFGQGAGAALGGGIGGFAGGGQFGFGLSLVGTLLGQAFDTAIDKAKVLASALADPITNFDALKDSSLLSSRAVERQAQILIDYGQEAQAAALIQKDLNERLGDAEAAERLTEATDTLSRKWAELSLALADVTAGPLTDFINRLNEALGPTVAQRRFEAGIAGFTPEQQTQSRKLLAAQLAKVPIGDDAQVVRVTQNVLKLVQGLFGTSKKRAEAEGAINERLRLQESIQNKNLAIAKEGDRLQGLRLQKSLLELEQQKALNALGKDRTDQTEQAVRLSFVEKIAKIETAITKEIERREDKQRKAAQDLLNLQLQNLKFLPEAEKQGLLREQLGPAIKRARLQGIPLRSISEAREFRDFEVEQQRLRGEAGSQLINSNSQLSGTLQSTAEVVRVLTASMDSLQQKNWEVHVTIPGQNGTKAGIDAVSGLSS